MKNIVKVLILILVVISCRKNEFKNEILPWQISVLPASVRLDPVTNEIIGDRYGEDKGNLGAKKNLLEKNWVFDGDTVRLKGARGEYISFQLVISNLQDAELTGLNVLSDAPPTVKES